MFEKETQLVKKSRSNEGLFQDSEERIGMIMKVLSQKRNCDSQELIEKTEKLNCDSQELIDNREEALLESFAAEEPIEKIEEVLLESFATAESFDIESVVAFVERLQRERDPKKCCSIWNQEMDRRDRTVHVSRGQTIYVNRDQILHVSDDNEAEQVSTEKNQKSLVRSLWSRQVVDFQQRKLESDEKSKFPIDSVMIAKQQFFQKESDISNISLEDLEDLGDLGALASSPSYFSLLYSYLRGNECPLVDGSGGGSGEGGRDGTDFKCRWNCPCADSSERRLRDDSSTGDDASDGETSTSYASDDDEDSTDDRQWRSIGDTDDRQWRAIGGDGRVDPIAWKRLCQKQKREIMSMK